MIKNRNLLIVTLICFLGINTYYFWESFLGIWLLPFTLACFIALVIVFVLLLRQIYLMIRERFADKPRTYSISGIALLLTLIGVEPMGLIDFEKREGKTVFFASHKGSANCTSNLKLTANHKYYVRQVCFGVERLSGTYSINRDTIKFNPGSLSRAYYAFAVVKKDTLHWFNNSGKVLYMYRSAKDTLPSILAIYQNELIK